MTKIIYECAQCGEKYDYEFWTCNNCGGVEYHKIKVETFEIWLDQIIYFLIRDLILIGYVYAEWRTIKIGKGVLVVIELGVIQNDARPRTNIERNTAGPKRNKIRSEVNG